MIAIVGRALLALLCAMTAPRPPVPGLPASDEELLDLPLARLYVALAERNDRSRQPLAQLAAADRPCWACGDPGCFHTEHLPCSNVPPFSRTSPTLPDGSTFIRRNW